MNNSLVAVSLKAMTNYAPSTLGREGEDPRMAESLWVQYFSGLMQAITDMILSVTQP